YALGNDFRNSKNEEIKAVLTEKLMESNPVLRGAAVWALRQGANTSDFAEMKRRHAAAETDPDVRAEWEAA
ncbi:MAG TPA: tRNA epoxyqueuosine(34) reductase QueG, partial [Asticcacaulis sp.]